jgi:hypothetical protein
MTKSPLFYLETKSFKEIKQQNEYMYTLHAPR